MVESKLTWQKFWTSLRAMNFLFDPPNVKNENIFTPLKRNPQLWIISKRIFQLPSKGMYNFFIHPQAGLQNILSPLTCRPTPYCWNKNDQPLTVDFFKNHCNTVIKFLYKHRSILYQKLYFTVTVRWLKYRMPTIYSSYRNSVISHAPLTPLVKKYTSQIVL